MRARRPQHRLQRMQALPAETEGQAMRYTKKENDYYRFDGIALQTSEFGIDTVKGIEEHANEMNKDPEGVATILVTKDALAEVKRIVSGENG